MICPKCKSNVFSRDYSTTNNCFPVMKCANCGLMLQIEITFTEEKHANKTNESQL